MTTSALRAGRRPVIRSSGTLGGSAMGRVLPLIIASITFSVVVSLVVSAVARRAPTTDGHRHVGPGSVMP